ncbi:MAG: M48 family metallopeptidase [Nocardioides sp.]|jgi:STE24 endopeptidase
MSARRWAWLTLIIGLAAFLVVFWWRVPWQPVPGGTPAAVPASEVFTREEIARAEHYSRWIRVWSWSSLVISLLTVVALARSQRLGEWLSRGRWAPRVAIAVVVVTTVGMLTTLPTGLAGWRLRRMHGLSTQHWWEYLRDDLQSTGIQLAVLSLMLIVAVGLARKRPRDWPLWAGLLAAGFVVAGSYVYPVVIEPAFNDFSSLPDGPLRTQVFELADAQHVVIEDVLVADASRRTTTLNAYVSGFGATRRVVLYDNLVEELPDDEVLAVVAHELAHASHGDVVTGTLLGAAGTWCGVGLLGLLMGGRMSSARTVPLVLALIAFGSLAAAPVENAISRRLETRADYEGLLATGDGAPVVRMQRQLALHSLADATPPRWMHLWFGSHPTTLQRIALAQRFTTEP